MKHFALLTGLCACGLLVIEAGCGDDDGGGCDRCPAIGATQCIGTVVELCIADNDGCLVYVTSMDCATKGGTCDDSSGGALCSDGCTMDCDLEGGRFCSGTIIQDCVIGLEGCRILLNVIDCADYGQTCHDSGEGPQCVDSP
jgi:hypothetical protein